MLFGCHESKKVDQFDLRRYWGFCLHSNTTSQAIRCCDPTQIVVGWSAEFSCGSLADCVALLLEALEVHGWVRSYVSTSSRIEAQYPEGLELAGRRTCRGPQHMRSIVGVRNVGR